LCLLPFALNESTRFISPTKTLEYMAAEKPVVSTPIHDVVTLYGGVVAVAGTPEAFIAECRHMLSRDATQRAEHVAAMRALVARHSWDSAAETVHQAIQKVLSPVPMPLASASSHLAAAPRASDIPAGALAPARHIVIGAGPTGLSAA